MTPTQLNKDIAHFWTGWQLVIELSINNPNQASSKALVKHVIAMQRARGDRPRCTDTEEVYNQLGYATGLFADTFGINVYEGESVQLATTDSISRAAWAFSFLLDLAYYLREKGFIGEYMPFFDLGIPDNRVADQITAAFGRLPRRI